MTFFAFLLFVHVTLPFPYVALLLFFVRIKLLFFDERPNVIVNLLHQPFRSRSRTTYAN